MSHVAFLIPGLDRMAGAERQVILLACGLQRRGWQVTVIALCGTGGNAAAGLESHGVAFVSLGMRKGLADPRGWWRFHWWLRRNRPDIVHAHLPHAIWMARWSRLAASIPLLVDTIHTSATGGLGRRLGFHFSDWLSQSITAVSEAAARFALNARMANPRKLVVLPNCVDVEKWRPDASDRIEIRRDLGVTDEFVWLAAGRLDPVKDYRTLLKAVAVLPASARLVIAGQGPLESELKNLCQCLRIENRVHFLGFQQDVLRWMIAADAFVLTSVCEGLPLALLEAGASALPAVATDVPGTREAVIDGKTAQLVPPGAPGALYRAMNAMMNLTPEARSSMGQCARKHVVENFSLEGVLNRWEQLYDGAKSPYRPLPVASEGARGPRSRKFVR